MDASQITFPVGEKFYFLLFKRSRVSCDNSPSGPGSLVAQSKQALLLNSQFNGEKEATISNKAGETQHYSRITFCSSTPGNHRLVRARSKVSGRTMHYDKLLSSNSCTANFQLYTQMALRLEEKGVHGECGSRFLCLFGGDSEGGRVTSLPKETQCTQDPCSDTSWWAIPNCIKQNSSLSRSLYGHVQMMNLRRSRGATCVFDHVMIFWVPSWSLH